MNMNVYTSFGNKFKAWKQIQGIEGRNLDINPKQTQLGPQLTWHCWQEDEKPAQAFDIYEDIDEDYPRFQAYSQLNSTTNKVRFCVVEATVRNQ